MKKEEALKIIVACAKEYNIHLKNNNFIFIFGNPKKADFFEVYFGAKNFLHLTGVIITKNIKSANFLRSAIAGKLKLDDFEFSKDGTTELKLYVLPQLMKIYQTAKMVSDFGTLKPTLYTEKLAGNVTACLGFVRDGNYYLPNTALREDIRNLSHNPPKRILAILSKAKTEKLYSSLRYIAKNISLDEINFKDKETLISKDLISPKEKQFTQKP